MEEGQEPIPFRVEASYAVVRLNRAEYDILCMIKIRSGVLRRGNAILLQLSRPLLFKIVKNPIPPICLDNPR
ncbi:hypothetical protein GCM10009099_14150 [Caenispirillum bisanense]